MFFETWKDEFIKKMEEEHKKRKEIQKRRKSIRKKQQEEGRRTAKKSEKIVTQAVIEIMNKYLPLLILFSIIIFKTTKFLFFVLG